MSARVPTNLPSSSFTVNTNNGLLAYWDLQTDTGIDYSTNGYNLTGTNVNYNGYLQCDTTFPPMQNSTMQLPTTGTIAFWTIPTKNAYQKYPIKSFDGWLSIDIQGMNGSIATVTLANQFLTVAPTNFFDGNPHFIYLTYAATVSTATSTSFASMTIDTTNILYSTQLNLYSTTSIQQGVGIGYSAVGTYYINRLGVWNRILNTAEISYLYNNGIGRSHNTA